MPRHSAALHHFEKRKRATKKKKFEPYPHPNPWMRAMDKFIYVIAIVGPIMTIPQVWIIWSNQNASGVSLFSWSAYIVTSLFWVTYGIFHKEKVIIFNSSLWLLLQAMVVIGRILYG